MAISDGTAGAWTATTTRNPTVTLPAHSAGQMLLVRIGWKSSTPTTDVAVCNTTGWNKLGQYYNGGGASSNGGGGVLVALFWKVAESDAETGPTIEFDDATSPTPGAYCAVTYSKGSSEAWRDPAGDGGAVAAATSYSGTAATHVAAASGDMLDAFVVTNDNTTLTVPTVSQSGLTLDTVTEYPATALSSTSSNDISADGCNRLATAGTSSAAAVMSGTNSVADPGAVWITRLRVYTPTIIAPSSISSAEAFGSTTLNSVVYITSSAIDAPTGTGYAQSILADAPVAYWRLGESSGTFADSSGNGHTATETGTVTRDVTNGSLTNGNDDGGISVANIANYLTADDHADFDLGDGPFSIEFWLRRDTDNGSYQGVIHHGTNGWGVNITGDSMGAYADRIALGKVGVAVLTMGPTVPVDTTWRHYVVTRSAAGAGNTLWYVNGSESHDDWDTTTTIEDTALAVTIAKDSSTLDGGLDELAIYDVVLTSSQISAHYSARSAVGAPIGSPTIQLGEPPTGDKISPTGISSAESFGTASILCGGVTVQPSAISSAEAFGTAVLKPIAIILPTGFATAETFGTPIVVRGGVVIYPVGIATTETFGTITILRGGVIVTPSALVSAEAFGSATLLNIFALRPSSISSAESFGTAEILRGGVTVQLSGIATAQAFGTAVLLSTRTVIISEIATAEAFGTTTLRSAARISPPGISTAEAFGTATILRGGVLIQPSGIGTEAAFGTPNVGSIAPPLEITTAAVDTAETFGTATILKGTATIVVGGIASAEVFGSLYFAAGQLLIAPTAIASAETFGTATLLRGNVNITVTGIATTQAFGTALIEADKTLTLSGIASTEQFGVPVVNRGAVTIVTQGATTAEALGTPSIIMGAGVVLPSPIGSAEAFGNATVSAAAPPVQSVQPVALDTGETFGIAILRAGMVRAIVAGIGTAEVVPNPTLYATREITPVGITPAEIMGSPILAKGSAYIRPTGIITFEIVPNPALANLLDSWRWINRSPGFVDTTVGGFTPMQSGLVDTYREEGEG